ncbi:MAG: T9SS type A sorting domain-containing protein [Candidatus Azobacteroides sp.]|nr:T9SS type A sorting domain-containing protein [Candidatus Azobacteroides sp.]
MNKKNFLLGVLLLMAGQLFAEQEWKLITLNADGTETSYALMEVQKIVFDKGLMTVNMKSGADAIHIACVSFLFAEETGIENIKLESSIFVFPNPVQTHLTIVGVDKNVKINLYDLKGTLLQSIFAQDNSTPMDVSSLQQGLYLLQIGEQVIKFIKQ